MSMEVHRSIITNSMIILLYCSLSATAATGGSKSTTISTTSASKGREEGGGAATICTSYVTIRHSFHCTVQRYIVLACVCEISLQSGGGRQTNDAPRIVKYHPHTHTQTHNALLHVTSDNSIIMFGYCLYLTHRLSPPRPPSSSSSPVCQLTNKA